MIWDLTIILLIHSSGLYTWKTFRLKIFIKYFLSLVAYLSRVSEWLQTPLKKKKLVALVLNLIFDLIQVKMQSKEITGIQVHFKWWIDTVCLFPDRYIILGGHRDSWVFGGIDPTTGAAVLQEIVRSFGRMKMEGNLLQI